MKKTLFIFSLLNVVMLQQSAYSSSSPDISSGSENAPNALSLNNIHNPLIRNNNYMNNNNLNKYNYINNNNQSNYTNSFLPNYINNHQTHLLSHKTEKSKDDAEYYPYEASLEYKNPTGNPTGKSIKEFCFLKGIKEPPFLENIESEPKFKKFNGPYQQNSILQDIGSDERLLFAQPLKKSLLKKIPFREGIILMKTNPNTSRFQGEDENILPMKVNPYTPKFQGEADSDFAPSSDEDGPKPKSIQNLLEKFNLKRQEDENDENILPMEASLDTPRFQGEDENILPMEVNLDTPRFQEEDDSDFAPSSNKDEPKPKSILNLVLPFHIKK